MRRADSYLLVAPGSDGRAGRAMTAGPGAPSRARADGFYLWRPPNYATASVAVQSRWGNLYNAPAAVRALAVDVCRQAQVYVDIAAPTDAPVADRLPGQSLRLRVLGLPTAPFRGRCRVLLGLGEVTGLVTAHAALTPRLDRAGDGMHVVITAAAPGALFGLAPAQAGRPPNVVKQAARMIRLLVDATAARVLRQSFPLGAAAVYGSRGQVMWPWTAGHSLAP